VFIFVLALVVASQADDCCFKKVAKNIKTILKQIFPCAVAGIKVPEAIVTPIITSLAQKLGEMTLDKLMKMVTEEGGFLKAGGKGHDVLSGLLGGISAGGKGGKGGGGVDMLGLLTSFAG